MHYALLIMRAERRPATADGGFTRMAAANLCAEILDLGGFDSSGILSLRGWNSHVHRKFPGYFESTNLSRDNLSREIGRSRLAAFPLSLVSIPCGARLLHDVAERVPWCAVIYLSIHPSMHLSIHPYMHLSIYPCIHPSIHLSIYPSIHLSRYMSYGLDKSCVRLRHSDRKARAAARFAQTKTLLSSGRQVGEAPRLEGLIGPPALLSLFVLLFLL